jgi:putative nucleotidyltransferase with HDIG domain
LFLSLFHLIINHHQQGLKILITLLLCYGLSFLAINENNDYYIPEIGQRWTGEDLHTNFDISENKDEAKINLEKDKILKNFIPIYILNDSINVDNFENSQFNISRNVEYFYLFHNNEYFLLKNKKLSDSLHNINVRYDSILNLKNLENEFSNINTSEVKIKAGSLIVKKNEYITESIKNRIELYYININSNNTGKSIERLGYFLIITMVFFVLFVFIILYDNKSFKNLSRFLFVLISISLFVYISYLIFKNNGLNYYIIPFCIIPIMYKNLINARVALLAHFCTLILVWIIHPFDRTFLIVNAIAGIMAVIVNVNIHYWSQFFIAIAYIFITYILGFLFFSLAQNANLKLVNREEWFWLAANVGLTLFSYPLIPLIEKLFGYTTDIRLIELSDLSNPLLKQLSLKAPGTFQHSLQVANLAESAANAIHANGLLAKVGSLYHDIGKIENALYFSENQNTNYNPHNDLPPEESALIIKQHVADGIRLAKNFNLPDVIIDFIRTHHGNTRIEFFYHKALQAKNDIVNENNYRYGGVLPFSKETAIVMIADAIEASSRSMKTHSENDLNNLVDKIIQQKIIDEQFINSNITMKEISEVKRVIKKMMLSIYNARISYPL